MHCAILSCHEACGHAARCTDVAPECVRPGKFGNAAHFTLRCGRALPRGGRQKPLVALVCDFGDRDGGWGHKLAHSEVETLFHEFGHALNSLLSRTAFQHLSGEAGMV